MTHNVYIKIVLLIITCFLLVLADVFAESSVLKIIEAWEAEGFHNTVWGRARERLSAWRWLGPLKPDAPRHPVAECGIPSSNAWWKQVVVIGAWRRLVCLTKQMQLARQQQKHFMWKCLSTFFLNLYRLYDLYYSVTSLLSFLRSWTNKAQTHSRQVEKTMENEAPATLEEEDDTNKELAHDSVLQDSSPTGSSLRILRRISVSRSCMLHQSACLTDEETHMQLIGQ
ncbi:hypothetical protein E2C01_061024 [Portunus trituberculatus]|uniref:Uncharacterized protein n=1 Tax=Portunus trituberculatus TaxID=210409 RepID=A0A5B7HAM5_PORTR|nr:hypothetical protein [Portunus trituberculatus]